LIGISRLSKNSGNTRHLRMRSVSRKGAWEMKGFSLDGKKTCGLLAFIFLLPFLRWYFATGMSTRIGCKLKSSVPSEALPNSQGLGVSGQLNRASVRDICGGTEGHFRHFCILASFSQSTTKTRKTLRSLINVQLKRRYWDVESYRLSVCRFMD